MRLPKVLYARLDRDPTHGGTVLLTEEDLIALAKLGETHEVGEYTLTRKMKVAGVTEITDEPKPPRRR